MFEMSETEAVDDSETEYTDISPALEPELSEPITASKQLPGDFVQIESLTEPAFDPHEKPLDDPAEPFPLLTDSHLEALRTETQDKLAIVRQHRRHTKEEAHQVIDASFDVAERAVKDELAKIVHVLPRADTETVWPSQRYALACALVANRERDAARLHDLVDRALVMKVPPKTKQYRPIVPLDGDFSYLTLEQVTTEIAELSALESKVNNTLTWRTHKRRSLKEGAELASIERALTNGSGD